MCAALLLSEARAAAPWCALCCEHAAVGKLGCVISGFLKHVPHMALAIRIHSEGGDSSKGARQVFSIVGL